MLYKLKQSDRKTKFVRLSATTLQDQGLLESHMEQWLADNPTAILPEDEAQVLVISQEAPFQNVTDILAVDSQGNLLIIEVKRGQSPRDVIAQALEYVSDVADWDYAQLNKIALRYFARRELEFGSLLEAFNATFGTSPDDRSESQFNQEQRLFIVSERIDEKLERTARWLLKRGVSINCVSYDCYVSHDESREIFLDVNEVVRPSELRGGGRPAPVQVAPPTEQQAIDKLGETLRQTYLSIRDAVIAFGKDVETYATRNYFVFKAGRVFSEVQPVKRSEKLVFRVRPEGFEIPEGGTQLIDGILVKRVSDSYGWTVNHQFEVTASTDLRAVVALLGNSYHGARRK